MPRSKHRKKPARSNLSRRFSHSSGEDKKMSEVLIEFIKPYRELAHGDSELEKLIGLGVIAWNVSLLPVNEREGALDDLVADLFRSRSLIKKLYRSIREWIGVGQKAEIKTDSAVVTEFKQIVSKMVEHKHRRFARNRRFIVRYHVEIDGDDVQLLVASISGGLETQRQV